MIYKSEYKATLYYDEDGEINIEGRNYSFSFLFKDGDDYVPIGERSSEELEIIQGMSDNAFQTCVEGMKSNIIRGFPAGGIEMKFEFEESEPNPEHN